MSGQSNAMPKLFYRDPLEVLMVDESKACVGCVYVAVAFNAAYCIKGGQYGRKCKSYREVERGGC